MRTALLIALALACAPVSVMAQDDSESAAFAHYEAAFGEMCFWDDERDIASYFPTESWELSWEPDYAPTLETATLYRFYCGSGAYNVNHVYYLESEFLGPMPVAFATPHFDVVYEDGDFDGAVLDIAVNGFDTQLMLTNSEFDPETGTITNHALWRGIGDASAGGVWRFTRGQFVLKSYDVDASYDGEINPTRIVSFD